jgi:hypothetical protein
MLRTSRSAFGRSQLAERRGWSLSMAGEAPGRHGSPLNSLYDCRLHPWSTPDDFAGPRQPGWDWQRFARDVLGPLLRDRSAQFQRYDWDADGLAEWHAVPAGGTVIVEGISSSRLELGSVWDFVVWVECPRDLRLRRGIERDGEALRWKWETIWMPEEEEYVRSQDPVARADVVVDGSDPHVYEQPK